MKPTAMSTKPFSVYPGPPIIPRYDLSESDLHNGRTSVYDLLFSKRRCRVESSFPLLLLLVNFRYVLYTISTKSSAIYSTVISCFSIYSYYTFSRIYSTFFWLWFVYALIPPDNIHIQTQSPVTLISLILRKPLRCHYGFKSPSGLPGLVWVAVPHWRGYFYFYFYVYQSVLYISYLFSMKITPLFINQYSVWTAVSHWATIRYPNLTPMPNLGLSHSHHPGLLDGNVLWLSIFNE